MSLCVPNTCRKPDQGIGSPGIGVTGNCELPTVLEIKPRSPAREVIILKY